MNKRDDPFVTPNDDALADETKADTLVKKIRGIASQQNFSRTLGQVILEPLPIIIGNCNHLDAWAILILEF